MAMIDYGAILKVNGVIKNRNQFFMDMFKAVGWVDMQRIRYEDCDCVEDGCSVCYCCPHAQKKHYTDEKLGEWDIIIGDCHGNPIWQNKVDRNFFVYAGDEDFTVAVYKAQTVFVNKDKSIRKEYWFPFNDHMVKHHTFTVNGKPVHVKIKRIAGNEQLYMRFIYKGDLYEIVYGYGIDSNQKTWSRIKHEYIGNKKVIRFVDKFWEEDLH